MEKDKKYISIVNDIFAYAKNALITQLESIDYDKDKFDLKVITTSISEPRLSVLYEGKPYLSINPMVQCYRTSDGHFQLQAQLTIRRKNDASWYYEEYKTVSVAVNEYHEWVIDQVSFSENEFFSKFLPVGKDEYRLQIKNSLRNIGIEIDTVPFDSMNQRYILNVDLKDYFVDKTLASHRELFLCKYMSLDTYLCILMSQKIRLNSIVSMNDTSESFFLGDYLCNAYDDIRRKNTDAEFYAKYPNALRYAKIIERKNSLIMSLTSNFDDALMWRLYGDNGKGVCMCFRVPKDLVSPIHYISENDDKLIRLRKIVQEWKKNGINANFLSVADYMLITKSMQFSYENEFRLIKDCEYEQLDVAKYGDLVSYYHDFNFKELGLVLESVYIGRNLPNWDVNYPLLVDLTNRKLGVSCINNSKVDLLRV